MMLTLLLALPAGLSAQTEIPIRYDTLRLDVSHIIGPVTRLILEDATEHGGKIYCLFRQEKIYGYGWDTSLFCVIDRKNGQPLWEYARGHYAYDGYFDVTDSGVTYRSNYDSLSATFDGSHWNYAPWADRCSWHSPQTLLDNERYRVSNLDLGEWGRYTWVKDKKSGRSYLYEYGYGDAYMRGDSLVLGGRFSIRYVDEEMLCHAKEGFCSLEKYRRKGFDWFVGITNGGPKRGGFDAYGGFDNWRRVRNAKLYTDTIGTLFQIGTGRDDWLKTYHASFINDSALVCRHHVGDEIRVVVQTSKEAALSVWRQGGLHAAGKLIDSPRRIYRTSCRPADGKMLRYEVDKNNFGLIRLDAEGVTVTSILHNQDSLPWLGDDGIEKTLTLLLDSLGTLTREAVAGHEASVGGTSDEVEWEPWRISYYLPDVKGAMMNAYYKTLADGLRLMSEYMIDSAGRVCGVLWDWGERRAYDRYMNSMAFDLFVGREHLESLFQAKSQQVEGFLTERLGLPDKKDGCLEWHRGGTTVQLYGDKRCLRLAIK